VPAFKSVKIYSLASAAHLSTLTPPPPEKFSTDQRVTSLVLNPHNSLQLIVGARDGTIRIWDFTEGILLRTIDIGMPIQHLASHEKIDGMFVAAQKPTARNAQTDKPARTVSVILLVPLSLPKKASKPHSNVSQYIRVGKTRDSLGLSLTASGSHLLALTHSKVHILPTDSDHLKSGFVTFRAPGKAKLTCLAVHPVESCFATGDTAGMVRTWYCLDPRTWPEERSPARSKGLQLSKEATSVTHWHAHPVGDMAFTPNGAYLLSGGEEGVLVITQFATGHMEFVPRLGAPIVSVEVADGATGEQEWIAGLADGTTLWISAPTLKIIRSVAGVKTGLYKLISHSSLYIEAHFRLF
jgi:NET1-associated nuclear protein 1 (U3 small nucleolar RNA-associated protein 17)